MSFPLEGASLTTDVRPKLKSTSPALYLTTPGTWYGSENAAHMCAPGLSPFPVVLGWCTSLSFPCPGQASGHGMGSPTPGVLAVMESRLPYLTFYALDLASWLGRDPKAHGDDGSCWVKGK